MLPWCLVGDMNNIVKHEDKRGGHPYRMWMIHGFQEVLDECELNDLELIEYPYTWERGHGTANWAEIKLDRVLVSKEFSSIFAEVKLTNLGINTFDHSPIFLEPVKVVFSAGIKAFRFENAWLLLDCRGSLVSFPRLFFTRQDK
ncbi:uncharacterized protein LOC141706695 [Apium graveolens]|uniref:uncharacterized protein LOC141706695 n=1 Tax=Apium graveolens TaxID=4045 RepID=UPI003D7AA09C